MRRMDALIHILNSLISELNDLDNASASDPWTQITLSYIEDLLCVFIFIQNQHESFIFEDAFFYFIPKNEGTIALWNSLHPNYLL